MGFITVGGKEKKPAAVKEAGDKIKEFLLEGELRHAAGCFPQDGETALEIYYCAANRLKKATEKV